jgi:hypothetical protein
MGLLKSRRHLLAIGFFATCRLPFFKVNDLRIGLCRNHRPMGFRAEVLTLQGQMVIYHPDIGGARQ